MLTLALGGAGVLGGLALLALLMGPSTYEQIWGTPKEKAEREFQGKENRQKRRAEALLVASENRERGRQRIEGRAARREQTSLQEAAMSHQSNLAMLTGLASLFGGGSQEVYGQMGAAGRPGFSPVDARVQNDMAMLARMGAV